MGLWSRFRGILDSGNAGGYASPRMPIRLPRRRFRQLCSTLGAVLALHLGVAQSAMAHLNVTTTPRAASAMDSHIHTPPCHEQVSMAGMVMPDRDTATTPAKGAHPNHGAHHAPCCDEGACQCVAGCYVSVTSEPMFAGAQDSMMTASFATNSWPSAPLARELRPPIAL